jgi:hypothetical protein
VSGYQGLAKQSIDVRLGGGIAQSDHEFVTDAPAALRAENARFGQRGSVGKRFGHTAPSLTGGPTTADEGEANAIFEHRDQLVHVGPGGCFRADLTYNKWQETNARAPRVSRVLTDSVVRTNYETEYGSADAVGADLCVAWQGIAPPGHTSAGSDCTYYQFFDADTLTAKSPPRIVEPVASTFTAPKVLALANGTFLIIACRNAARYASYTQSSGTYTFANSVDVPAVTFLSTSTRFAKGASNTFIIQNPSDPAGGQTTWYTFNSSMTNTGSSTTAYVSLFGDIAYNDVTGVYVAMNEAGAPVRLNSTCAITSIAGGVTPPTSYGARICQLNDSGHMMLAFQHATGTRIHSVDSSLSSIAYGDVPFLGFDTSSANGRKMTLGPLLYLGGAGIDDCLITFVDVIAGTGGVSTYRPLEQAAVSYNPQPYAIVARPVTLDSGSLGVAEVGRFLQDKAIELHAAFTRGSTAHILTRVFVDIPGAPGVEQVRFGFDAARVDLESMPARGGTQCQGLRVLPSGSGGVLCYDGVQLAELTPPRVQYVATGTVEPTTGVDSAAAPDTVEISGNDGWCRVRICYRWVDARGNVHRGAPSYTFRHKVFDIVTTGGTPDYTFRLVFPRIGVTAINGDLGASMQVEVYQADSPSGEEWYLVGVCTPQVYDTTNLLWAITPVWGVSAATLPDHCFNLLQNSDLIAQEQAFFDLELEPVPPPPMLHLCSTQRRLWGVSAEDRNAVHHTKLLRANTAPEFTAEGVVRVPDEGGAYGGECTGIAALNDRIIVFKRDRIYAIFGDPGDDDGTNSTLEVPRLISSDVGCIEAASIVEGPFGVAFLSRKGFAVLGSDGSPPAFIGEAVQREHGDDVVCGTLVPRHSEVRWHIGSVGSATVALVWNYKVNAWSRWTAYPARHACVYRDEYHRIDEGVQLYIETSDSWAAGNTAPLLVQTPWLKLAGLQGFKRLWRATFLGRYWTGGLKIETEFDYVAHDESKPGEWREHEWTSSELLAASKLSQEYEAGAASTAYRLQVAIRPVIQKIESVRFTLREDVTGSQQAPATLGQGFEIVGVQLDCGMKRGGYKALATGAKR